MPKRYYEPQDVRAEHARQVLDFLNSARIPEEIAEAVEVAGELDVGPLLAARILARRDQLGGFNDLREIRAIPLIGPERFTEIVACLSDAPLPWDEVSQSDLLAEVQALRREMQALRGSVSSGPRVKLRALQSDPYLGQRVNVVATVTEANGIRPRADAPITLIVTGGRIRTVDGTLVREGRSVTTRTDGNGNARALLLPALSEDLLPVQDSSLQAVLRHLRPEAATPRDTLEGLQELARQYRWHGNPFLREAVDVYFRDFGSGLIETVNAHDYLASWKLHEVTIVAYLREFGAEAEATPVEAAAALTVPVRNWLAPWLEVMQAVATQESDLDRDLKRALRAEEEAAVMGRVYTGVRDFLTSQRGIAGEYIGRRVAERSLRDFAVSGIAELPIEWQTAALPALDVASKTIAFGGTTTFAAVGQTRTDLTKEIDDRVGKTLDDLNVNVLESFNQRLSGVEEEVAQKADVAVFTDFRNQIEQVLDLKVDTSTFEGLQREVDSTLQNVVTVAEFQSFRTDINQRLESKVDRTAVGNLVTAADFQEFRTSVTTELEQKADVGALSTLNQNLSTIRTSVERIDRDVVEIKGQR